MYRNLLAEMTRCEVTKKDMAKFLRLRYATVVDKTNGKSRFYLDEAFKIRNHFFPHCEMEYLFMNKDSSETKLMKEG
ncbi:XRE family transcriptional regulator [Cytobacillus horneckiae]|uniref:XRE family transcriptional regulator n=1 Tax=Cytobacillus horneckiae TaxID=549687 RepID=UPI0034CE34FF